MLEFIESRPFTTRLLRIAGGDSEEVLWAIQSDLLKDPKRGKKIEGTGGLRKARTADPIRKKGKRGGFRYIYIYFPREEQIGLLFLFDKEEKEDLTKEEKKELAKLAADGR